MSGTISLDGDGVRSVDVNGTMRWQIRWSDLAKIVACKIDAFTCDIICIGFVIDGVETIFCCDEEQVGWKELNDELRLRYNVKLEDWWAAVAFPAFVENFKVIWERPHGENSNPR